MGKAENPETFPGDIATPQALVDQFQHASTLSDAIPVQKFIKLEATDESFLREVSEVIFVDGHWTILDRMENQVYLFAEDGTYVRKIGRYGEGPGEYISARYIAKVWGELIGVVDAMRGRVLLFETSGELIRETARIGDDSVAGKFPIISPIIWPTPERLYLSEFGIAPGAPQHVALDYTTEEGAVLYGFGQRCEPRETWALKFQVPRTHFITFFELDNRIWSPNPHGSHIEVFDQKGHLLGKLSHPHPNNITYKTYKDVKPTYDDLVNLHQTKFSNREVYPFGDLVIQWLNHYKHHLINVYDRNGALLAGNLKPRSLDIGMRGSTGQHLIGTLQPPEKLEWFQKMLTDREYLLIQDAGFDPNKFDENDSYLILWGYPSQQGEQS